MKEIKENPHRAYNINDASKYSVSDRLLIKPKLSPFASKILNHLMPRTKMPSCKYDGNSDPKDHIAAYEGHMYLYT